MVEPRVPALGSSAAAPCARIGLLAVLASGSLVALLLAVAAPGAVGARAAASRVAAVQRTQALVRLLGRHQAMSAPSGGATQLQVVSAYRPLTGERTVLPVLGDETDASGTTWLRVMLPGRPNGRTGWIRRRGTDDAITPWRITVDLSERRVVVYDDGRAVRSFEAVVGKPSTPTPQGKFFVEETVALNPTDVGAPFALALSARSDVLQEFDGGPGQIALHGLANIGGILGSAASHGCVRLADTAVSWLAARIGPGVPVTITN